ncbi:MAG: shikimate dehydrogenase family protein [Nitrososphaerales archaeon]
MTSETKRVFLLGRGIENSLSPRIQNAAFRTLSISTKYELKELGRAKLAKFVLDIPTDVLGFNVTAPFKEEIMQFLDSVDSRAKSIGAVNTVKIDRAGKMHGFNTDYDGVIASLQKLTGLNGKKSVENVVLLGSGGAARACVFALLKSGFRQIKILNRTLEKAQNLSKQFIVSFSDAKIEALKLTRNELTDSFQNCSLLINAISDFSLDIDFQGKSLKFFDLHYMRENHLIKQAEKNDIPCIDGLFMLVIQAAKSFEIWTGKKAPVQVMMRAAKQSR